jgi:hypothetical protein
MSDTQTHRIHPDISARIDALHSMAGVIRLLGMKGVPTPPINSTEPTLLRATYKRGTRVVDVGVELDTVRAYVEGTDTTQQEDELPLLDFSHAKGDGWRDLVHDIRLIDRSATRIRKAGKSDENTNRYNPLVMLCDDIMEFLGLTEEK